ncbi:MAG: TonB-dependent receptor [Saprospiraceae bacterium]|nr:TonB-dependent receptor [Saprospiraceae bacterium]
MNGNEVSSAHFYREENDINRLTTQVKFEHKFGEGKKIEFRNSFNFFNRELLVTPSFSLGKFRFAGDQVSSFLEIAFSHQKNKNVLIAGLNFYSDDFKENVLMNATPREENYKTVGAFANYVFDLGEKISVESGLRTDYVVDEKLYVLPRISALFKWTEKLTTRIGGGLGYRNASMFNQEAEILGYRNVSAVDRNATKGEESYGGNFDLGYKTPLGDNFFLIFNQMFFYTQLKNPLVLEDKVFSFVFENANGITRSYGAETFFKLGFYNFVCFVGYTYTNAQNRFNGRETVLPLTPQHSIKGDVLYALPNKWRIGFDYEFKSGQTLSNGKITPSYWTTGAIVEYTHHIFTFFGNIENFSDVRQTNFGNLNSPPFNTPQLTEIWAPLDGFVFNAGLKIRLKD